MQYSRAYKEQIVLGTGLQVVKSEVEALANQVASDAATAENAKDLALQAWQAAIDPIQTLPAVDLDFFPSTTLVTAILYDTTKDSDGGAWRKRCRDKSWYNEPIYGAYLGSAANEGAARALSVINASGSTPNLISGDGASVAEWSIQDLSIAKAYTSGELVLTLNGASAYIYHSLSTTAGRVYKVTVGLRAGTNVTGMYLGARDGTGAGTTTISESSATAIAAGTYTMYFTALSSATAIRAVTIKTATPATSYLDNFTVEEYDPTAATTNDYYYDTTAGAFKALNAGSGTTTIYRGGRREFPARSIITAETGRVVIWDIDFGAPRMWRVFVSGVGSSGVGFWYGSGENTASSLGCSDGKLFIGLYKAAPDTNTGLRIIDFIADTIYRYVANSSYCGYLDNIVLSASVGSTTSVRPAGFITLVNAGVNAVAITVQPGAPIDPATGLPMPTIAVGTDGGVSVLVPRSSDYAYDVWDVVVTSYTYCRHVGFDENHRLFFSAGNSTKNYWLISGPIPSADQSFANTALPSGYASAYYTGDADQNLALFPLPLRSGALKVNPVAGRTGIRGTDTGLEIYRENPTAPTKGMGAKITHDYNSGWLVGGIKRAWLADTVAETVAAATPLSDDFDDGDYSAWTLVNGATASEASGSLTLTNGAASAGYASRSFNVVVGKTYILSGAISGGTGNTNNISLGNSQGGSQYASSATEAAFEAGIAFVPTVSPVYVSLIVGGSTVGLTKIFDNVSVKLAEPDRSVNNKAITVVGSLTKSAVASGAQLVGYSGFSAANYLEEAYSSDLDFGTGDFHVMGWVNNAAIATRILLSKSPPSSIVSPYFEVQTLSPTGYISWIGNATTTKLSSTYSIDSKLVHAVFARVNGVMYLYLNGVLNAQVANTDNYNHSNTDTLRIGARQDGYSSTFAGSLALWRIGSGAPTQEQIREIYETEKKLFEANAQCTLAGTSSAVLAVDHDDTTGITHVLTSYGRSGFKGLVRVEAEATAVGTPKAVAADDGCIVQVGSTSADYYAPAKNLRETAIDLGDKERKLFDYDLSSATTCTLPLGWKPTGAVWSAGAKKREGAAKDFTITHDGFLWSVVMAASTTAWVQVEGEQQ